MTTQERQAAIEALHELASELGLELRGFEQWWFKDSEPVTWLYEIVEKDSK